MRLFCNTFVLIVALGGMTLAAQQVQKRVLINDKKGEFKIYDVDSHITSFDPGGDMEFEAAGSPLRGFSKQQGLTFSAKTLDGRAVRSNDGSLRFKRASIKGEVVIDTKTNTTGGGEANSHVEGNSLLMEERGSATIITFDQPFTYTSRQIAPGVERTITLSAPSGEFVLPLLSQASGSNNPFKNATLKGPVAVEIESNQASNKWHIALKADAMTYDEIDRTLKLTGHVTGDVKSTPTTGEPFGFDVYADWLHVILDDNSAVKTIKSGTGGVKSKGGGQ